MSYHFPIFIKLNSRGFGLKEPGELKIYVGSSKSNSHLLGKIEITKSTGNTIRFDLRVDGKTLKTREFTNLKGRAGKHVQGSS